MTQYFDYQVNPKEKRYLVIRIIFSVLFYLVMAAGVAVFFMFSESVVLPVVALLS